MPRFSILTPVFNGQAHIERMMQSIAAQTCKDFEHLILDGGSTDGTLAVAEKHKGANTKIISRKDKGPIDAINQAWRDTRGDFILVVCSDDWIEPEMIEKLSLLLEERPEAEVLCYGLSFWIEEGAGCGERALFATSMAPTSIYRAPPMTPASITPSVAIFS